MNFVNGYTPKAGDMWTVLNFGSRAGTFGNLNLPPLPRRLNWELEYGLANVVLRAQAAGSVDTLLISGTVTATNGSPIAGASVYALLATNHYTNALVNGSFELPTNNNVSYTTYNPGATTIPG